MSREDRFNFREPNRCNRCGHFAYWMFSAAKGIDIGKMDRNTCGCDKFDFGVGYEECGPLEQSSAHRDIHENLIYEGDIIRYWGKDSCGHVVEERIHIVHWEDDGRLSLAGDWGYTAEKFSDMFECEIIGNIYENPDIKEF